MSTIADYYNVDRLARMSLAKLERCLRSEWCADSFCALLLECLDEIGNKDTLSLLGNIAAENYDVLATYRIFEAGGPGERLAPFVLPGCVKKLKEVEALHKEAETRCEQLRYELRMKETESDQNLRNRQECNSFLVNWSNCRNSSCDAEFRCTFDTKGPAHSPTYILRYTRCRCRHE